MEDHCHIILLFFMSKLRKLWYLVNIFLILTLKLKREHTNREREKINTKLKIQV
jgi:hypothetical protein